MLCRGGGFLAVLAVFELPAEKTLGKDALAFDLDDPKAWPEPLKAVTEFHKPVEANGPIDRLDVAPDGDGLLAVLAFSEEIGGPSIPSTISRYDFPGKSWKHVVLADEKPAPERR